MNGDREFKQTHSCCMTGRHTTEAVMSHYIRNELSAWERGQVELRLTECETCLELLMQQLEAMNETVPNGTSSQATEAVYEADGDGMEFILPDMKQLEDRVIVALQQEQQKQQKAIVLVNQPEEAEKAPSPVSSQNRRRPHLLQHPAAQYAIAASITLLLLGSGSFSSLSQRLAAHDQEAARAEVKSQATQSFDPAHTKDWSSPTWSERMVDQTSSWLDGLQSLRYK